MKQPAFSTTANLRYNAHNVFGRIFFPVKNSDIPHFVFFNVNPHILNPVFGFVFQDVDIAWGRFSVDEPAFRHTDELQPAEVIAGPEQLVPVLALSDVDEIPSSVFPSTTPNEDGRLLFGSNSVFGKSGYSECHQDNQSAIPKQIRERLHFNDPQEDYVIGGRRFSRRRRVASHEHRQFNVRQAGSETPDGNSAAT
ncbi:MAG: hypothetical protein IID44_00870 [Planctomycetes bacterium]|nr:hypothetical protein [Planctomycetota bacterium]